MDAFQERMAEIARDEIFEITDEYKPCPNKSPEPHILGEFPMDCTKCHNYADY